MENSCIGLCYPEAEGGILTFLTLQATSDPWWLPPDWRGAAPEQECGKRSTWGQDNVKTEKFEFVLHNVIMLGN